MATGRDEADGWDERLCEIIGAYYAAGSEGREPDRAEWLA